MLLLGVLLVELCYAWSYAPTYSSSYVRLFGTGESCSGCNLQAIASAAECQTAFDALGLPVTTHDAKHNVDSMSYSFLPSGCMSQCSGPSAGFFCRGYNSHGTGNGGGTDVATNRYMVCKRSPADLVSELCTTLPHTTVVSNAAPTITLPDTEVDIRRRLQAATDSDSCCALGEYLDDYGWPSADDCW
jgi:hypothetical protein